MKALVTGAGGFIGTFLVKALKQKGYEIRGLFLPDEEASLAKGLGVEVIRGDLTRPKTLSGICDGVDIVFHLATRVLDWGSAKIFRKIMVDGTKKLLVESSGKVGRFVYFSSIAALGLGRNIDGLDEDAMRIRLGVPYSDTKIDAEDLVRDFSTENKIPFTIIRPANVIGPGSPWVKDVLDAYYKGPLPLVDGGRHPGAFVYVTNLVDGTILAADSKAACGRTYHFRDDFDITWGEYVKALGSLIGKKPMGSLPFRLGWELGHFLEIILSPFGIRPPMTRLAAGVMGRNLDVDCSRAKKELGWKSRVGLNEAMGEIEKWVKEVYIPNRGK